MTATTEIAETEISTATNPAPSKLLPILSGSTSPFLPGETPPLDMPAQENTMDGEKSDVEYAEKPASLVGATSEAAKVELPPSPSLTRQASHDSENFVTKQTAEALDEKDVDVEPEEVDRTDWHPMDHTRSDSKDLNTTQETTFVDDTLSHEVDEKYLPAPAPRNVASNPSLRIIAKPPSPQPWDLVDPPTSNNGDATDYYSTLGTKNFGTLQKNIRSDIPHSTYYFGPPPADSAYGSTPVGRIGVHHPREVFRVERDYTGGELVQFTSTYPLELEGRITPTQFIETINAINELLISAHSIRYSLFNNLLAVFTLQISRLIVTSHYEKEMRRLEDLFHELNTDLYNPVGLNLRWPRKVAFLFLEVEYY